MCIYIYLFPYITLIHIYIYNIYMSIFFHIYNIYIFLNLYIHVYIYIFTFFRRLRRLALPTKSKHVSLTCPMVFLAKQGPFPRAPKRFLDMVGLGHFFKGVPNCVDIPILGTNSTNIPEFKNCCYLFCTICPLH